MGGGAWNLLGTFALEAGTGNRIVLNAAEADGTLVADAIRIVRSVAAGEIAYIHTDHFGQPQKLTDATASLLWDRVSLPFGATHSEAGLGEAGLRFPGQWADAESGLHYNTFRDYDPSLGRYIQSDPIGLAGGLNIYGYVGANPLTRIDPTGETPAILIPVIACAVDPLCIGPVIADAYLCLSSPHLCQLPNLSSTHDGASSQTQSGTHADSDCDDDEDDFCYQRYEIELATCRALGRAERSNRVPKGSASRCYESAQKRPWARKNNTPEPPFHGWPQY